ncbi:MAG: TlpA family protein disulfide reductase [Holophaga sp.]|nr:TlpA family protein disulfide reductase [Holophaga sp.]
MIQVRRCLLPVLTVALLSGCGFGGGDKSPGSASSRKLVSQVSFLDATGQRRSLAEFTGKVLVVDVWATWCPPCRASLPEVAALQKKGGETFVVLPISVDRGGWGDVKPFLDANAKLGLEAFIPAESGALDAFGSIGGIPTTLIVDRRGRLRERWSGYYPGRVEKALEAALKEN